MANPMSVVGIRRVVDALCDEVMEAAQKAARTQKRTGTDVTVVASGKVRLNGAYGFDRNGKLGFRGTLRTVGAAGGVPVGADLAFDDDSGWDSKGAGTINAEFAITATVNQGPDEED